MRIVVVEAAPDKANRVGSEVLTVALCDLKFDRTGVTVSLNNFKG